MAVDMSMHKLYEFLKQHNLENHCHDYCRIVAKKQMNMHSTLSMPCTFEQQVMTTYMMRHDFNGAKTTDESASLLSVYKKQKASMT